MTEDFSQNRVSFNIGGEKFETTWSTLWSISTDRLAHLTYNDPSYDAGREEFFFDRNPVIFRSILEYHRTGQLHIPSNICIASILPELEFWEVSEMSLAPCCWVRLCDYLQICADVKTINDKFGNEYMDSTALSSTRIDKQDKPRDSIQLLPDVRQTLWRLMEEPRSSLSAKIWLAIYGIMVALSVLALCFWSDNADSSFSAYMEYVNMSANSSEEGQRCSHYFFTQLGALGRATLSLELITNVYFTVEFFTRLISCPSTRTYFRSAMTWINVVCVVSVWFELATIFCNDSPEFSSVLRYIVILDAIRIFRVFNVLRHAHGWRMLCLTLQKSIWEICVLCAFIFLGMLMFATLIFYAQFGSDRQFPNIPTGFWWAIVTMTTVGYGDTYPTTNFGYVIGGFCALSGMLATGLPIPIIARNFDHIRHVYQVRMEYIRCKLQTDADKEERGDEYDGAATECQPIDLLSAECLGMDTGNDYDRRLSPSSSHFSLVSPASSS